MTGLLARHHRRALVAVLAVHALLLSYSAAIHSPVIDEPAHVAAGLSHWRFGDFALYRVNPPLVRLVATAPLLVTGISENWELHSGIQPERREHSIGDDLIEANGSRIFRYVTIARWACIPFSLVGAVACYAWGRLLFGRLAGLAAAALWCLSPTILGHGSLLTPDAAGAATGLAAVLVFARWLGAPSWRLAVLAGALIGIAEACKSTWVILFVLLPLIWLTWRLVGRGAGRVPPSWQLVAIVILGWLFLLASYGFSGVGRPLGEFPLRSSLLRPLSTGENRDGTLVIAPGAAALPMPLPADYVIGLDQQQLDLESPNRNYLRGTWRTEGWWYYYVYGIGVKETCGALALAGLGAAFWGVLLAGGRRLAVVSSLRRRHLAAAVLIGTCPLTVLALASANTGMNHHVRYVLPLAPFLYVLAAGLFWRRGPRPRLRIGIGAALTGYAALSSLLVYPHSLSYFNEWAGGPRGGVYHLNNSNIDWGQDLLLLRDWQLEHEPGETIHLAYFGRVDPAHAGIKYKLAPQHSQQRSAVLPNLAPGWYAVSVTLLQGRAYMVHSPGQGWVPCEEEAFGYFRVMAPGGRVGYSIYLYRVE